MKTIIFDLDGTLIDSGAAILATLRSVLERHGVAPARPLGRDLIGPPLDATLATLTGSGDAALLERLAADFKSHYDTQGYLATETYAGIDAVLRELAAAGASLHLATNKRARPTHLLLAHFGWEACFTSVYCLDSRSPAFGGKGSMLTVLLEEHGLAATDCVYVGDTSHDEAAAAQAGIPFVAVEWGYGTGEQAVSAAAPRVRTAAALKQFLAA